MTAKIYINAIKIILKRKGEKITYLGDDYSDAYITDVDAYEGVSPYLVVKDADGVPAVYPLDYWAMTLVGRRKEV